MTLLSLIVFLMIDNNGHHIYSATALSTSPNNNSNSNNGSSSKRNTIGQTTKKYTSRGLKNQNWYNKRKAGINPTRNRTKPPQWEREGDDLYKHHNDLMIQQQDDDQLQLTLASSWNDVFR